MSYQGTSLKQMINRLTATMNETGMPEEHITALAEKLASYGASHFDLQITRSANPILRVRWPSGEVWVLAYYPHVFPYPASFNDGPEMTPWHVLERTRA